MEHPRRIRPRSFLAEDHVEKVTELLTIGHRFVWAVAYLVAVKDAPT